MNFSVPLIDTLLANVRAGESELTLRLLPPIGTEARKLLDETLQKLKAHANEVGRTNARPIWKQFFLIEMPLLHLGLQQYLLFIEAKEVHLKKFLLILMFFGQKTKY